MHVTIIGVGLIGCSLGLALRKNGHHVCGVDKNSKHLEEAKKIGGIDNYKNISNALSNTDLVVLCLPVDAILKTLPKVLDKISGKTTVMDMGSTKFDICQRVDKHKRRANFVAAHPLAGVEHSGPKAAHVDLYLNARVLICDVQKSSSWALSVVTRVFQELKMKTVFMDSDEHDQQLALVSHLPQFMAYALASLEDFDKDINKNWVELGGGGLQSSIRLGKSDAGMWMPIFEQNKAYLLQCVDNYMNKMNDMKNMIENNRLDDLRELIKTANNNYEKLNYGNNKPGTTVENQSALKIFYS